MLPALMHEIACSLLRPPNTTATRMRRSTAPTLVRPRGRTSSRRAPRAATPARASARHARPAPGAPEEPHRGAD
jgi:hypothetical protein